MPHHGTFEVTVMLVLDAAAPVSQAVADKVSTGGIPAWVTEIVRLRPPPVTITVPLLDAKVFSAA